MTYHSRIMNIATPPVLPIQLWSGQTGIFQKQAYDAGHRDARHVAAEIATQADATIAELLEALRDCVTAMVALHCGEVARAGVIAEARTAIARATGEAA